MIFTSEQNSLDIRKLHGAGAESVALAVKAGFDFENDLSALLKLINPLGEAADIKVIILAGAAFADKAAVLIAQNADNNALMILTILCHAPLFILFGRGGVGI